jgi:FeS assembly protein IscX
LAGLGFVAFGKAWPAKCQVLNAVSKEASMPKELTWDHAEDIGILLAEKHPDVDPLAVRYTDLHQYVTALPDFKDDPKKSNEGKLEAIQMAWQEEFLDKTQG